jgi:alpha-glucosidase
VWDETKLLEGEIGKFATIVRRTGDDWFLGSLTGNGSRNLNLKPDFLAENKTYTAKIYSFNPNIESSTKVEIEEKEITKESVLNFEILENSGLAIRFMKK